MNCSRAQELFSDHLDGTQDRLLASELAAHLAACSECRELRDALGQVVDTLRGAPEMDAPAGLAERAALAALAAAAPVPRAVARPAVPAGIWLAAAALAAAMGAGIFYGQRAGLDPVRTARRLGERSVNAGAYLLERKDRLVEDVRLLRVVIGTAFEGRVERVNDRVDDYRKLLEKRRAAERGQQGRKGGAAAIASPIRSARHDSGELFLGEHGRVRSRNKGVAQATPMKMKESYT
jgi:hypothetical protein